MSNKVMGILFGCTILLVIIICVMGMVALVAQGM